MRYSLRRTRDDAGDSGGMSLGLIPTYDMDTNQVTKVDYENDARPRIGMALRVGSLYARTFSGQDWWQTTLITKILEDTPGYVRFKTGNSEYEWTCS